MGLTLTAGLLSGCVGTRETTTDTEGDSSAETSGGVVNVYNWGEYIDESVLTDFEEATGIKRPCTPKSPRAEPNTTW